MGQESLSKKVFIILPTYNESENIQALVREIFLKLPEARILIVDDNSPDGTGEIAENLAKDKPRCIHVLHRPKKEGLGRAYRQAFQEVLKTDAELIIQMDSDFSHPVGLLPNLIEPLNKYDFVIGSRYISGGKIKNWNILRRMVSRFGNFYARNFLRIKIRDLTGGFKAYHRRVLEYLVRCPIDSKGYFFQIETTLFALKKGFRCLEIPFIFTERAKGKSKMSNGVVWEAMIKTLQRRGI